MGKLHQLSPELWPLIYVILFSYIELIFRGGVSCLPAALLFTIYGHGGHFGHVTTITLIYFHFLVHESS